MADELQCSR